MLVHTSIRAKNMDKSIAFYTRLLDLTLISRREIPQNNAEIAFLRDSKAEGAMLELTCYSTQKKYIQPDYEERLFDHLAFEVKDIQESINAMRSEKVTITDEPFRLSQAGPLIAFVEDPDGTLIELIERK